MKVTLPLLALVVVVGTSSNALPSASAQATIDGRVFEQLALAPTSEVTFLVHFSRQADLLALQGIRDRIARRMAVAAALKRTAEVSQAPVRALLADLERQGLVSHVQAFFSTNTIAVTGRREAVQVLAGALGVDRIEAEAQISLAGSVVRAERSSKPRVAVEPNIGQIRAPAAWRLGFQGKGIIVGTIGTGARWTHEALKPGYKCLRAASHKNCWFDAVNGLDAPYDDHNPGHGTHVIGILAGRLGIGVARKAKWVACKAFNFMGTASKEAILQCADFFTALALDVKTAAFVPDVFNNSWGSALGNPDEEFFNGVVDAWNAAGIHSAFPVGNSGPDCWSTSFPGAYSGAFGVGAVDGGDLITDFSSRGPTSVRTNIKPDVVAPGVSIRSAVASCDTCYGELSGTTLATPHAAGTLALMLSKNNSLTPAEARAIAENSAKHISDLSCGGSPDDNNVYGHGRIDALNAVSATP